MTYDFISIGGGAAGYFTAILLAERCPSAKIAIIEASSKPLSKLKISGGGRCNVTHECNDIAKLLQSYPRGNKELRSLFSKFKPQDMRDWLSAHGVETHSEDDNRVFPESNKSESIIECFQKLTKEKSIHVLFNWPCKTIEPRATGFLLESSAGKKLEAKNILIATGSSRGGYELCKSLGHNLVEPLPSLFSFNIEDARIKDLAGLSFENIQCETKIGKNKYKTEGPMIITHWGLSGPAILKLSAFAARDLASLKYQADLTIRFISQDKREDLKNWIHKTRDESASKKIWNERPLVVPNRYWLRVCENCGISPELKWGECSKVYESRLIDELTNAKFQTNGKTTYKEEFVTTGGVKLKEIDFREMKSKLHEGLYFAGEVIDVDGVTGGFNFQNCWSGSFVAAEGIAKKLS